MPVGAWKLIIEDDAGKQIVVPFAREIITIGRKEGNTIRLTERNVSRNHAKLSKDNGDVLIEDLGSFNGIRLNGDRIDGRMVVHEGDTIQIGDYHLAIHAQGVGPGEPSRAPTVPNLTGVGGPRSIAANPGSSVENDQFAGDTQRWEPPPGMQGMQGAGQTLPTQEDHALGSDDPLLGARVAQGGFGLDNGDTERVTLDMLSSIDSTGFDSLKSGATREDLESTLRHPTSDHQSQPPTLPTVALLPASSAAVSAGLPRPTEPWPERSILTQPRGQSIANVADALEGMTEQTGALRPSVGEADDSLPRLVVLNTIFAGSAFPLRTSEAVIGRTEDNDITIEHKSVSRNHAKIVREGDRVRILDLKSANGVLVNNEEVEAVVLRSGDVVELGRVRMRFVPVGERFTVPADEIERARIADRAGDDFDNDSGTGITNPVRKQQGMSPATGSFNTFPAHPPRPKLMYIALGAIIGLLIVIAVLVLREDKDDKPGPGEDPPSVRHDVQDPEVVDPPVKAPAKEGNDGKDPELVDERPDVVDVDPAQRPPEEGPDRVRPIRPKPKPARLDDVDVQKQLDRVQDLVNDGRNEEARRVFKKVADARPDHSRVKIFKTFSALK